MDRSATTSATGICRTICAGRTNTPAPTASTAARRSLRRAGQPAIPAIVEPRPGDEFPVEELGPGLAMVARATARATGVPAGLAAMTVLTTCSLMTQQHIDVLVFDSIRPTSLMALAVASSGERKTTVDNQLLGSVRVYERTEVIRLEADKEKYRIAHQMFEAQVKATGDAAN